MASLERAVRDLERDNADLRALIAAAVHDIKNPLTSVVGFLELLEQGLPEDLADEVRSRLHVSATRAWGMLEGLQQVLHADDDAHDPVVIDLARLVADVTASATDQHPRLRFRTDVAGAVAGNPDAVRELLTLLIHNAVTHVDADPVEVSIDRIGDDDEDVVVLRIGDNGTGVDARDRDRIFHVFQQAQPPQEGSGIGIGLAIARRLSRALGGDVWLDEQPAPGGGAAFMISLPAAPAEGADQFT